MREAQRLQTQQQIQRRLLFQSQESPFTDRLSSNPFNSSSGQALPAFNPTLRPSYQMGAVAGPVATEDAKSGNRSPNSQSRSFLQDQSRT